MSNETPFGLCPPLKEGDYINPCGEKVASYNRRIWEISRATKAIKQSATQTGKHQMTTEAYLKYLEEITKQRERDYDYLKEWKQMMQEEKAQAAAEVQAEINDLLARREDNG